MNSSDDKLPFYITDNLILPHMKYTYSDFQDIIIDDTCSEFYITTKSLANYKSEDLTAFHCTRNDNADMFTVDQIVWFEWPADPANRLFRDKPKQVLDFDPSYEPASLIAESLCDVLSIDMTDHHDISSLAGVWAFVGHMLTIRPELEPMYPELMTCGFCADAVISIYDALCSVPAPPTRPFLQARPQ